MPTVPLFGRGYKAKSATVTAQKLTNFYRESIADPDKTAAALYGTPGLALIQNLGTAAIRGIYSVGQSGQGAPAFAQSGLTATMYAAAGNKLYRVADGATIGTLQTSSGRVWFSDNGTQMILVDGLYGYTVNLSTNAFAQITDVDFAACNTVDFLAGYFITDGANGQAHFSNLYDGTDWDSLDFFTAESNPDPLVAVKCIQGEAYMLGAKTVEVWAPSTDGSAFRRVVGSGIDWGCASYATVQSFDGGLVMLAKPWQGEVRLIKIQNYQVSELTGPEQVREINSRNFASATGYAYLVDGHAMYQLNFPDLSMLYDAREQQWYNVSSGIPFGSRHYGECSTEAFGMTYVGDYRNGNIYRVDKTLFADAGDTITRRARSRHIFDDDFFERFSLADIYIDFEKGVGLSSGQGSDPMAMLRISRDNGKTWGNEMWRPIGKQGNYLTRAVWNRIGFARDFVLELTVSDPINWVVAAGAIRLGDE